jgi:hypothetical protein
MARDHRDRAELAHRARVAEHHAVQQAPFDVGQRHAKKVCQPPAPSTDRRLFFVGALRLHQRDELARDERER